MIAIASILMTIAHPGIFFPAIGSRNRKAVEKEQAIPGNAEESDEKA